MKRLWLGLLLVSLSASGEGEGWTYRKGQGYVHSGTGKVCKDGNALFKEGESRTRSASTQEAVSIFFVIFRNDPEKALREKACFMVGRAWWAAGDYQKACLAYGHFLREFPRSARAAEAKEQAMWCALQFSRMGETVHTLGVIPGRSGKKGREMLRVLLKRYPREAFSARYALILARLLVEQEEIGEAEGEYLRLVERYTDGENARYAGLALLDLAKLQMRLFTGLDYDIAPVREARRYCQRFLDTPVIRESDAALAEKVRKEALRLDELLARKLVMIADYYESRGYSESALSFHRTILKLYPGTKQAKASRALLKRAGGKDAASGS